MSKPGFNLSGEWSGQFSYPRHLGPTTPFLARIEDRVGSISGTIIEPNIVTGGATAQAAIKGLRAGTSVDFTKTYPAEGWGYENPVDYVGSISEDGNVITGVWSLLHLDGTFEMHRDATADEPVEEEAAVALPEPIPVTSSPRWRD